MKFLLLVVGVLGLALVNFSPSYALASEVICSSGNIDSGPQVNFVIGSYDGKADLGGYYKFSTTDKNVDFYFFTDTTAARAASATADGSTASLTTIGGKEWGGYDLLTQEKIPVHTADIKLIYDPAPGNGNITFAEYDGGQPISVSCK
jgi:hypothetical protein